MHLSITDYSAACYIGRCCLHMLEDYQTWSSILTKDNSAFTLHFKIALHMRKNRMSAVLINIKFIERKHTYHFFPSHLLSSTSARINMNHFLN